eukprot:CAMPEP_0194366466 /NCGR_PEP_ID=MMETSP0174-20130528/14509_1 /TAXON_ID=216777 /ORGANISM="Proboscia alata, Strain PI-D3" /LENGTH=64 /DNA_ID=CAMNT_0039141665 /DNA_START=115 /DNA_END=309 /DNA_ORIENTATION=-
MEKKKLIVMSTTYSVAKTKKKKTLMQAIMFLWKMRTMMIMKNDLKTALSSSLPKHLMKTKLTYP